MKSILKVANVFTLAQASTILPDNLTYDPVQLGVSVVRSIATGLNLYQHVDGLTVCDFDTQNTMSTFVNSVSTVYKAGGNSEIFREGFWLFTDSLGLSSYSLRSCYRSWTNIDSLYDHYWSELGSFPVAASEVHDNIINYQSELNTQGFTSFIGLYTGRYQDFAYGLSRSIYLTTL